MWPHAALPPQDVGLDHAKFRSMPVDPNPVRRRGALTIR
jgi:hypothetical protein